MGSGRPAAERMRLHKRLVGLGMAALIAIAYPYLELAWKCRPSTAESEACVWARAYFPLSRWVEPLVIAPIAWLVIAAASRLFARDKPPRRTGP